MQKNFVHWMFAAILVCGASVFTSCSSNDDNPTQPDLNVAEKIIGKWMVEELDGQACPTNLKAVITFLSPTKAYGSLSVVFLITIANRGTTIPQPMSLSMAMM